MVDTTYTLSLHGSSFSKYEACGNPFCVIWPYHSSCLHMTCHYLQRTLFKMHDLLTEVTTQGISNTLLEKWNVNIYHWNHISICQTLHFASNVKSYFESFCISLSWDDPWLILFILHMWPHSWKSFKKLTQWVHIQLILSNCSRICQCIHVVHLKDD